MHPPATSYYDNSDKQDEKNENEEIDEDLGEM